MNTYRMEYERQHKKDKLPIVTYIAVGLMVFAAMMALTAAMAYADVAPKVIYQQDDIIGKTAEVGIAPGVNVYVPDYDETTTQNATDISRYQQISANISKQHEYSNISISDTEMEELKRMVAAEAQTQSMEGRKAVVEVIFNRVLSPEWPNTVHGVLSQKGQFATWRMRNASWVTPDAAVAPIEYVLEHGLTVLPSTEYVYFDTRGVNGRSHIRIQDHVFGR